jgi:DeoR/GlpR family transcriptional regulator of sugar metabolism
MTIDGKMSNLHRWAIARRIIAEEHRLTVSRMAEQAGVSLDTAQRDVLQWSNEGWIKRHGTGTHIYWRLPGQGPLANHAPERRERIDRLLAELGEWGALTAEDAAELNHCSVGIARRDLNTLVFAGEAVRLKGGGRLMVWRQQDLLDRWQWNVLVQELPVTAGEAAQVWAVGAAAARQRLAVLEAAGLLRRISGDHYKPDRFAL